MNWRRVFLNLLALTLLGALWAGLIEFAWAVTR